MSSQVEAAQQLLGLASEVPSASVRIKALAHIWVAVVALDLNTRAARRAGEPGQPAVELRLVLSDPHVAQTVSATTSGRLFAELCKSRSPQSLLLGL